MSSHYFTRNRISIISLHELVNAVAITAPFRYFPYTSTASFGTSASSSSNNRVAATAFFEWCHNNEYITQRKVTPVLSPQYGYGLQSTRDIKKGDVILSVGKEVWGQYSVEAATEYVQTHRPDVYKVIRNIKDLGANEGRPELDIRDDVIFLTTSLMNISKQNDEPYIRFIHEAMKYSQPSSFVMNEAWMECLKGTSCEKFIEKRRHLFTKIGELFFHEKLPDFLSMLGVIASRAISGDDKPFAIVPYLDLANHSCKHNAMHEYNTASKCYELRSVNDILEGEEVFINYGSGRFTNSYIYLYGFMEREPNHLDILDFAIPFKFTTAQNDDPEKDEWRYEFANEISDGCIHFGLLIEVYLQTMKEDWQDLAMMIAELVHGGLEEQYEETDDLSKMYELYKAILKIARCSVCKTQEEYDNWRGYQEKDAVNHLLDTCNKKIGELEKHQKSGIIVDNNGDSSKPSKAWQDMCNRLRQRELDTLKKFALSIMLYGEYLEAMRKNDPGYNENDKHMYP